MKRSIISYSLSRDSSCEVKNIMQQKRRRCIDSKLTKSPKLFSWLKHVFRMDVAMSCIAYVIMCRLINRGKVKLQLSYNGNFLSIFSTTRQEIYGIIYLIISCFHIFVLHVQKLDIKCRTFLAKFFFFIQRYTERKNVTYLKSA